MTSVQLKYCWDGHNKYNNIEKKVAPDKNYHPNIYSRALEKKPVLFCGVFGLDGATCNRERENACEHRPSPVQFPGLTQACVPLLW